MNDNTVFFSISDIKVMTAMHLLKENGIMANKVNKMDSAHPGVFGDIQIIIAKEDEERARTILKDAEIL